MCTLLKKTKRVYVISIAVFKIFWICYAQIFNIYKGKFKEYDTIIGQKYTLKLKRVFISFKDGINCLK